MFGQKFRQCGIFQPREFCANSGQKGLIMFAKRGLGRFQFMIPPYHPVSISSWAGLSRRPDEGKRRKVPHKFLMCN